MRKIFVAAAAGLCAGTLLLAAASGFAQGDGQPQPPPEPPAVSPAPPKPGPIERYRYQISGELSEVDAKARTLRIKNVPNNFVVPLKVDEETSITMDGKQITLEQLPAGAQVRASYTMLGDELVAKNVTVTGLAEPGEQTGVGGSGEQAAEPEGEDEEDDEAEPQPPRQSQDREDPEDPFDGK